MMFSGSTPTHLLYTDKIMFNVSMGVVVIGLNLPIKIMHFNITA